MNDEHNNNKRKINEWTRQKQINMKTFSILFMKIHEKAIFLGMLYK